MLNEETLFGPVNKVSIAIERIKTFEPMALNIDPAGYYVCISGGKDSSVIQELCLMAGVQCEFVHNFTTVDYPETVCFLRREQERLKQAGYVLRFEYTVYKNGSHKTMWNMIPRNGFPTRIRRWCCHEFKKFGQHRKNILTGGLTAWEVYMQVKKREIENVIQELNKALCQKCHNKYDAKHRAQTKKRFIYVKQKLLFEE